MSIFQKPSRHQFIVTSCVLVWIFIVNVAAIALGIAGWPLFFVTIFFFALGADMKNVPSIFAGGTLGLIAALGLVYCSRSGIVNIGVEGMMLIGSLMGVVGSYYTGSALLGALVAIGVNLIVSLVFAFFAVTIKADQNVIGTAINTFATGLTVTVNRVIFGVGTSQNIEVFERVKIPVLSEIPIIGTAITDFAQSGLVDSNEAPGCNVTGTSDLTPVADQIELLHEVLPEAKTIGLLYCSAESNSDIQVALAEEACKELGLQTERYSVASSNEIQSVIESMIGKVDAIYAPTDNVIANGMNTVAMVANENKIPVVCGEENMVNAGGLVSYSIDYYDLGYMAGEMAVQILRDGADPAEMPIQYLDSSSCTLVTNEDTAAEIGVDLSVLEDK